MEERPDLLLGIIVTHIVKQQQHVVSKATGKTWMYSERQDRVAISEPAISVRTTPTMMSTPSTIIRETDTIASPANQVRRFIYVFMYCHYFFDSQKCISEVASKLVDMWKWVWHIIRAVSSWHTVVKQSSTKMVCHCWNVLEQRTYLLLCNHCQHHRWSVLIRVTLLQRHWRGTFDSHAPSVLYYGWYAINKSMQPEKMQLHLYAKMSSVDSGHKIIIDN